MIATVNGHPRELPEGSTVATVLDLLEVGREGRGVAVALDGTVVSRSRWAQTPLDDGALLEVVGAIQGG
jgi:sulfur carrier protein